ncbi:MAG: ribosomal protein S18-alanine N-acetyltransferase [Pseudomonadota bacterium]
MVAVIRPAIEIRAMRRADVSRVNAIEQASYPYPWTKGIIADCLRVGYHCRVLTVDREIAAYAFVTQAIDESHLLNLCVSEDYRRQGLARLMLMHLMDEVQVIGASRMFLEVRPSNPAAIALYESMSFRKIGRRPGYYPTDDGREDAVVMVCHLDEYLQESPR